MNDHIMNDNQVVIIIRRIIANWRASVILNFHIARVCLAGLPPFPVPFFLPSHIYERAPYSENQTLRNRGRQHELIRRYTMDTP